MFAKGPMTGQGYQLGGFDSVNVPYTTSVHKFKREQSSTKVSKDDADDC